MPPETPRTTLTVIERLASLRGAAGCSLGSSGLGGGVDVLAGEQVVVDLAERDRQRLLLDVRVDEGADVLQEALAELGVVGVDLAGTLGAVEHQLVLAVGLGEQVVDRGVGDALGGDGGRSHGVGASLVRCGWSRSNHQGYQLVGSGVNFVVDDGDVELTLGRRLARAVSRRRSRSASVSVPRPTRRRTSSSHDGGLRKTNSASGIVSRTWRAPWRSISSIAGCPDARARSTGPRGV